MNKWQEVMLAAEELGRFRMELACRYHRGVLTEADHRLDRIAKAELERLIEEAMGGAQ